jgi:hypothetical protein
MEKLNQTQLEAMIAKLQAENKALKERGTHFTCKVSQKGAVSVYGLGRWPVTLYRSQMERFLENAELIRKFMAEHKSELKDKPAKADEPEPKGE